MNYFEPFECQLVSCIDIFLIFIFSIYEERCGNIVLPFEFANISRGADLPVSSDSLQQLRIITAPPAHLTWRTKTEQFGIKLKI